MQQKAVVNIQTLGIYPTSTGLYHPADSQVVKIQSRFNTIDRAPWSFPSARYFFCLQHEQQRAHFEFHENLESLLCEEIWWKMHLLLRCQMSSRHPWTLSSVGIWNVQDRRVNFYLRMSKLEATVLNVRARAQLSDDFDLSSVAPTHEADSLQSGSLPCAK